MIFKDWNYRKKHKMLFVATVVILILSWFLVFQKTFELLSGYHKLLRKNNNLQSISTNSHLLLEKIALQDSLIALYSVDSIDWISNLLPKLSRLIPPVEVGLIFENKPLAYTTSLVAREFILTGSFTELQKTLPDIERLFFIQSLHAYLEKEQLRYRLVVIAFLKQDNK